MSGMFSTVVAMFSGACWGLLHANNAPWWAQCLAGILGSLLAGWMLARYSNEEYEAGRERGRLDERIKRLDEVCRLEAARISDRLEAARISGRPLHIVPKE